MARIGQGSRAANRAALLRLTPDACRERCWALGRPRLRSWCNCPSSGWAPSSAFLSPPLVPFTTACCRLLPSRCHRPAQKGSVRPAAADTAVDHTQPPEVTRPVRKNTAISWGGRACCSSSSTNSSFGYSRPTPEDCTGAGSSFGYAQEAVCASAIAICVPARKHDHAHRALARGRQSETSQQRLGATTLPPVLASGARQRPTGSLPGKRQRAPQLIRRRQHISPSLDTRRGRWPWAAAPQLHPFPTRIIGRRCGCACGLFGLLPPATCDDSRSRRHARRSALTPGCDSSLRAHAHTASSHPLSLHARSAPRSSCPARLLASAVPPRSAPALRNPRPTPPAAPPSSSGSTPPPTTTNHRLPLASPRPPAACPTPHTHTSRYRARAPASSRPPASPGSPAPRRARPAAARRKKQSCLLLPARVSRRFSTGHGIQWAWGAWRERHTLGGLRSWYYLLVDSAPSPPAPTVGRP